MELFAFHSRRRERFKPEFIQQPGVREAVVPVPRDNHMVKHLDADRVT